MSKLILENGKIFEGKSFGANVSSAGELVFSTGMMGYPESLTDPSYKGQILVITYPLVGNYGIPDKSLWESGNIQISGLIVSNYIDTPNHFESKQTLASWLKVENIPALEIKDTRLLTQMIRDHGSILGKIENTQKIGFYDPNQENLVEQVSTQVVHKQIKNKKYKNIILIDCGAKRNIERALLERSINLITVPWDFDLTENKLEEEIDGVVISNGPGNPKFAKKTIENVKKLLNLNIPILGICLGNQILTLAAGGDTSKLKYGHRSQNQPCIMTGTKRCYITTQNHGFHVSRIPEGFKTWFTNANDYSNEGIIHKTKPVMSVQFHPEATPGPHDCEWIFDYFIEKL